MDIVAGDGDLARVHELLEQVEDVREIGLRARRRESGVPSARSHPARGRRGGWSRPTGGSGAVTASLPWISAPAVTA